MGFATSEGGTHIDGLNTTRESELPNGNRAYNKPHLRGNVTATLAFAERMVARYRDEDECEANTNAEDLDDVWRT